MTKNKTLAFIERSISEILNDHFKSFLSRLVNIRTWTVMTENVCKSLRFNTMSAITTRFGRKRGTLECGLHDDHTGNCDLLASSWPGVTQIHIWLTVSMGPDALGKFLFILRKNLSSIPWDKCARWFLDLPNFVKAYQTSKTPSSCLGAGQIFVRREICQICQFTRHDLKEHVNQENLISFFGQSISVRSPPKLNLYLRGNQTINMDDSYLGMLQEDPFAPNNYYGSQVYVNVTMLRELVRRAQASQTQQAKKNLHQALLLLLQPTLQPVQQTVKRRAGAWERKGRPHRPLIQKTKPEKSWRPWQTREKGLPAWWKRCKRLRRNKWTWWPNLWGPCLKF